MLKTIKARILIGYAAILLVTIIAAIVLSTNNRFVASQVGVFIDDTLPALEKLDTLQMQSKQLLLMGYSLYGTTLSHTDFVTRRDALRKEMVQHLNSLKAEEARNTLKSSFDNFSTSLDGLSRIMSASRIDWDAARENLQQLSDASGTFNQQLLVLRADVSQAAQQRAQEITTSQDTSQWIIYLLIGVMAAVAVTGFLMAQRWIGRPIEHMANRMDSVANERDLTATLPTQSSEELQRMQKSILNMMGMFREGMAEVSQAVEGIDGAIGQLATTSTETSHSVTHLQQDIVQLVDLMTTLESDMEDSYQRSHSAAEEANSAASQIDEGRSQVKDTATAISGLATDLEQTAETLETLQSEGDNVSNVVKTIAEIADQTNLLALNAAIEAARAGESGRGFAVVADEVRTLAVRTHQSTVEINAMLEKIVDAIRKAGAKMNSNQTKVNRSVALADTLVETLEHSRESILSLVSVSDEAASLASHSRERVGDAKAKVGEFEKLGDTLSEGSRNIQSASSDLSALAQRLTGNVEQFRIER